MMEGISLSKISDFSVENKVILASVLAAGKCCSVVHKNRYVFVLNLGFTVLQNYIAHFLRASEKRKISDGPLAERATIHGRFEL